MRTDISNMDADRVWLQAALCGGVAVGESWSPATLCEVGCGVFQPLTRYVHLSVFISLSSELCIASVPISAPNCTCCMRGGDNRVCTGLQPHSSCR